MFLSVLLITIPFSEERFLYISGYKAPSNTKLYKPSASKRQFRVSCKTAEYIPRNNLRES